MGQYESFLGALMRAKLLVRERKIKLRTKLGVHFQNLVPTAPNISSRASSALASHLFPEFESGNFVSHSLGGRRAVGGFHKKLKKTLSTRGYTVFLHREGRLPR